MRGNQATSYHHPEGAPITTRPVITDWRMLPSPGNQLAPTGRRSNHHTTSYHHPEGAAVAGQPVAATQKTLPAPGNQLPPPRRQEQAGSFHSSWSQADPGWAMLPSALSGVWKRASSEAAGCSEGRKAAGDGGRPPSPSGSPAARRGPPGTGKGSRADALRRQVDTGSGQENKETVKKKSR